MLKKLSLAALVAMGSMSVASATDLTQAIKGVNLNGFLRIRFYNETPHGTGTALRPTNRWRTNAVLIFSVPVAQNISFVVRNSTESNVYSGSNNININGETSTVDSTMVNNLLFMKYSKDGVNAILGKIPVATSITSADPAKPSHGAGAIASYTINSNVTVAGAYVDALEIGATNKTGEAVVPNDIYAAAAIFNTDMVNGQAWAYKADDLINHIYTLSVNFTPIKAVDVHADYANSKLQGMSVKKYYNVSAKGMVAGACVMVGYAKSSDGESLIDLSDDAPFGAVIPTANNYNIADKQNTSATYIKAGYQVNNKANVYAAYQYQNDKTDANKDISEVTFGGNYAYTKKLAFNAYYDIAKTSNANDNNTLTNNEFRFEAKYSF